MRQRLAALLLLLLFPHIIVSAGHGQTQTLEQLQVGVDLPQSEDFTTLQQRDDRKIVELPNGLIVIAQELPAAPVVSGQVWVKTGSIFEQEYVGAGISHYLEHMLSGGSTQNRSEAEINRILGQIGARTNAATGLDNVRYFINSTSEHTDVVIDLLSDYMQHNTLDQGEVDRERQVIQQEFSMGEGDPRRLLWRYTQQARYQAHPARHPTIGYIDEFMQISRDDLWDFYQRMYPPNNLLFVVAGDIDSADVVRKVAGLWEGVERRELPQIGFPQEPALDEPREVTTAADVQRPRLRLAFPGVRLGEQHDYALDVLGTILGQGNASRLVRELRDRQRLVNSVSSYNASWSWGEGFFGIDAEVASFDVDEAELDGQDIEAARIDRVRQAVRAQIERVRDEAVSEDELARAQRRILADIANANQTAEGVASRLARDVIATGDPDYLQRYAEAIEALRPADLQAAAQAILDPDRLITVRLMPLGEDESPQPLARDEAEADPDDFPQQVHELDNRQLVKRMHTALADHEAERRPAEVGDIQTFTLENGLELIVQRSTLVPAVAMQAYWKGGLLGERPGEEGKANAMAEMLMRGTRQRDAQALAERLDELGARLSSSAGNNTTYLQARALSDDWEEVMDLLAEVMRQPAFDEDEWEALRPRLAAGIRAEQDQWYGELNQRFRGAWYGEDHPWSQSPMGRERVVENLTAEDLRDYHAGQLAGENLVVAVVGDIEPEQAREAVAARFGDLPAARDPAFEAPTPPSPQRGVHQHETRKPVAAVKIGLGPVVDRVDEDYAALRVIGQLMSDFPSGWLNVTLRGEGEGLAYAQWARLVTGLVPGYYEITFNSSAELVPEAVRRTMGVVRRAKEGPLDEQDLQRARAGVLTGEFFRRQSNSDRAMGMALDRLYGVEDLSGEQFRRQVQALEAEAIHRVAREHLGVPTLVLISNEPVDEATLEEAMQEPAEPEEIADEPDYEATPQPEEHW